MEVLYGICGGVDVHKKLLVVCLRCGNNSVVLEAAVQCVGSGNNTGNGS